MVLFAIVAFVALSIYTKSFSPLDTVVYKKGGHKLSIEYCRPFKKDRVIFGELIPYDQPWRTGANEATLFETKKDISIGGNVLPAGKYSLWTIPGENAWVVIFNKSYGQWGIKMDGDANFDPKNDALRVPVSVIKTDNVFEQFTIAFEEAGKTLEMVMMWDQTMIAVPILLN